MVTLGSPSSPPPGPRAPCCWLLLVVLAIIIDAAVQANQVVSQRIIFSVAAEVRGRVNALYMTITFIGGALGSLLGTVTYFRGGWTATRWSADLPVP